MSALIRVSIRSRQVLGQITDCQIVKEGLCLVNDLKRFVRHGSGSGFKLAAIGANLHRGYLSISADTVYLLSPLPFRQTTFHSK
jgi:hypothetical protein